MKEVIKKQFESAPKRKGDEKPRMTQMIGLVQRILTILTYIGFCHNQYTNMAATSHVKLDFLKSKVTFC